MKVSEIFFSLNGEGLLMGVPTIFVRLSGCNLNCVWCDTKYAQDTGTEKSVEDILEEVLACDNGFCDWVLLTGGEPLLQEIGSLVHKLKDAGYRIGIETNGSIYCDSVKTLDFVSADIKPPSSGNPTEDLRTFKKIVNAIKKKDGQIKAVIADKNDYQFIQNFVEENGIDVLLTLQPCWGTLTYQDLCTFYFENPITTRNIRILTQIHKIGGLR